MNIVLQHLLTHSTYSTILFIFTQGSHTIFNRTYAQVKTHIRAHSYATLAPSDTAVSTLLLYPEGEKQHPSSQDKVSTGDLYQETPHLKSQEKIWWQPLLPVTPPPRPEPSFSLPSSPLPPLLKYFLAKCWEYLLLGVLLWCRTVMKAQHQPAWASPLATCLPAAMKCLTTLLWQSLLGQHTGHWP